MASEKDIFESIADILESKLGIKAHFISATSPAAQDKFTLSTIARNARASFLINNDRLVFPITIEDDFWGAFFIAGAQKYTVEQVSKIQNMITRALTIESENQIVEEELIATEELKHLLIQSDSHKKSHDTAFTQHEKSTRFAFFDASCISGSNFESVENIQSLGPVTVWINDVPKLSEIQKESLKTYLAIPPQANSPLVVISSNQPLVSFLTEHTLFVQHEMENLDNLIWFDRAMRDRQHITQDPTLH